MVCINVWNGSGPASILTLMHTITYDKGNNRMVLVGVSSSDTFLDPESMTYNGKPMTRAVFAQDASGQSYAGIYFLLDAQLPDTAGTQSPVVATFASTPVWGHGGFDVLELKN